MLRKAVVFAAGLALLNSYLSAGSRKDSKDDAAFAQIDAIVKTLSDITGMTEKHAVPYGHMSKGELRKFLGKRIKKTLKPDEIYADELSLKMFGLVPQDFDLKKSTIDLLTEQAAAFYDYDEKKLFMLEDSSFAAETTTLAHELSHALADQYFNLGKYMEDSPANDDENLAHTAVVEGQASWLMIAYELKQSGQPPVPTPEMVKSVADTSEASMADYPVLKNSPLYIQESLLFPYSEGTTFFDAVYKKMGQRAFAAVFIDPPVDSAQVMHPEKYFAHEKPAKPDLPKLNVDVKVKEITEGSMGEFDHGILLRQYLGDIKASMISGHLRGGQFKIVGLGKSKRPILVYSSVWDSGASAAEYFAAYKKVLHSKWKHLDETTNVQDTLKGTGDNGFFEAHLRGERVTSVEGMQSPIAITY
jgi:hypothetical protein